MSRRILIGLAALLVLVSVTVLVAVPVLAAELRGGGDVTVASGEVIDEDLYVAGDHIIVNGTINGDLWAAGGTIINGTVNGSVLAVGGTVNISGEVTHTVRVAGRNLKRGL